MSFLLSTTSHQCKVRNLKRSFLLTQLMKTGDPVQLQLPQSGPARLHPVLLRPEHWLSSHLQLQQWEWAPLGEPGSDYMCQKGEDPVQVSKGKGFSCSSIFTSLCT